MKLFQARGEGPGKRFESRRVRLIRTVKAHGFTLGARQQVHMIVHDRQNMQSASVVTFTASGACA